MILLIRCGNFALFLFVVKRRTFITLKILNPRRRHVPKAIIIRMEIGRSLFRDIKVVCKARTYELLIKLYALAPEHK